MTKKEQTLLNVIIEMNDRIIKLEKHVADQWTAIETMTAIIQHKVGDGK